MSKWLSVLGGALLLLPLPTSATITAPLSQGSTGPVVTELQTLLKRQGYYTSAITGKYGGFTIDAVKAYQGVNRLPITGTVNTATAKALNTAAASTTLRRPTLSFTVIPNPVVSGKPVTMQWKSAYASSCTGPNNLKGLSGSLKSQPIYSSTPLTITCTGKGGIARSRVLAQTVGAASPSSIARAPTPNTPAPSTPTPSTPTPSDNPTGPTLTLTPSAKSVPLGSSVSITWSSTGATTCAATPSSAAHFSGLSGTFVSRQLTVPTTYSMICMAADGATTEQSVTVGIGDSPPPQPQTPPQSPPSTGTPGICGSSHNQSFTTKPTNNLCSSGTPSTVSGTGPWTWSCIGSNGGGSVGCVTGNSTANPNMPQIPQFSSGTIYYFDGLRGDDNNMGTLPASPKKNIHTNTIAKPGNSFLLKRGTTVELQTNLYPHDMYIGAYGDSNANTRAILAVQKDQRYSIGVEQGQFMIENIHFIGNPSAPVSGMTGISTVKSTRSFIRNNVIDGFYNGIVLGGDAGEVSGNTIRNTSNNAIFVGNNNYPAPSRNLIESNSIDGKGTGDGISLHDGIEGLEFGKGNIVRGNTIFDVTRENAVDIQNPYDYTVVENNTIYAIADYAIVDDHGVDGTVIRNNRLFNLTRSPIVLRSDDAVIENNVMYGITSSSLAGALVVSGTNVTIRNNDITVESGNARTVIVFNRDANRPVATGAFIGNHIKNKSTQKLFAVTHSTGAEFQSDDTYAGGWTIDNNTYEVASISGRDFLGNRTWGEWRSAIFQPNASRKDQQSTYTVLQ